MALNTHIVSDLHDIASHPSLAVASHPAAKEKHRISVCHIVAGDAWAGAEVQVTGLLKYLSRDPDLSVHAVALSDSRFASELQACGIDVCVLPRNRNSFWQIVRACNNFVTSRQVSILHSHKYEGNIISSLVAHRARIPHLVRTAHGCAEPYSPFRQPKHWIALRLDHLCTDWKAEHVIAVSSEMAQYYPRFLAKGTISVIRNGVDRELVSSPLTSTEAKMKLGLRAQHFVIGTVGRLEPIKRHDLFIATARRVADQVPDARFLIAGSGRQLTLLRKLVSEAGLKGSFDLLGGREDIYDVVRAMDVLLICSDHEGLPTTMLEAMVLGVPVVARRVGGIPEVIEHRLNGLLISSSDPDDLAAACVELHRFQNLRRRLAENASRLAQIYSAERMAEKVAHLYRFLQTQRADSYRHSWNN